MTSKIIKQILLLGSLSFLISACKVNGEIKEKFDPLNVGSISITSDWVEGGSQVVITGGTFNKYTTVFFGSTECENVVMDSETQLTCTTPAHAAGSVDITISDFRTYKMEGQFTFYDHLSITSISPTEGFLSGGSTITLTGTGFKSGIDVKIDGVTCNNIQLVSASQVTCENQVHDAGAVDIVVTNTNAETDTLSSGFTYKADLFTRVDLVDGALSDVGFSNGIGGAARFNKPTGLEYDGTYLYVSDTFNHVIRRVDLSTKEVTDFVGLKGTSGSLDGIGTAAQFNGPTGLKIVGGDMYVLDTDNCIIRKIDMSTKVVTTYAGQVGLCSTLDGIGTAARFGRMWGIDSDGTYLYIADSEMHAIRQINLANANVIKIAGSGIWTQTGITNGDGSSARFYAPMDLHLIGTDLYVADASNKRVRKVDVSGAPYTVSTVAGGLLGHVDAVGTAARFNSFGGITSDGTYLYISDTNSNTIRRVNISTTAVDTIAGTDLVSGFLDATGASAQMKRPGGMLRVGSDIYFTDIGNNNIRKMNTTTFAVETVVGMGAQ